MKKFFILITCLLLLVPLVNSQQTTYYGRVEAAWNLAKGSISDSLSQASRLDSLILEDGSVSGGDLTNPFRYLYKSYWSDRMTVGSQTAGHSLIEINPAVLDTTKFIFGIKKGGLWKANVDTTGKLDVAVDPTVATITAWIDSTNITEDGIGNGDISPNSISTTEIRDATIDSTDVKDGSLSGQDLVDDAVTLAKIEESTIDSTVVKDGSLSGNDLIDDAITAAKIEESVIDSTHVANDGIGNANYAPNSISTTEIRDGTIALIDMNTDSVDSNKVKDLSVSNADLRADAVTGDKIQASAIDSTDVKDGSLSGQDLVDDAVTLAKIEESTIDSTVVKDGSLSGADLVNDAITADKIEESVIDSTHVANDGIGNANYAPNSISTTEIRDATIDSTDVKDASIAGGDIATGGISGTQMQSNAIDSTKTKDGSLSVSDIANGANGFVTKPAFADSVKTWLTKLLPMVSAFDTTGTVSGYDSLTVTPYLKATAWPDSGVFLRAMGNSTAVADTVIGGVEFQNAFGDSLIVFCRADTSAAVVKVNITLTGYNGDVALNAVEVYPSAANVWQRKAFVLATPMKTQEYLLQYQFICTYSHTVDITRCRLK